MLDPFVPPLQIYHTSFSEFPDMALSFTEINWNSFSTHGTECYKTASTKLAIALNTVKEEPGGVLKALQRETAIPGTLHGHVRARGKPETTYPPPPSLSSQVQLIPVVFCHYFRGFGYTSAWVPACTQSPTAPATASGLLVRFCLPPLVCSLLLFQLWGSCYSLFHHLEWHWDQLLLVSFARRAPFPSPATITTWRFLPSLADICLLNQDTGLLERSRGGWIGWRRSVDKAGKEAE